MVGDKVKSFTSIAKKNLQTGSSFYSKCTELRALVNLIPGIGSSIDVIISNEFQQLQYERIIKTMDVLNEEMNKINEKKIDRPFIGSEDFKDLLWHFLDRVVKVKDREKVILYCRILVGSIKIENANERRFADDMIDLLSNLSIRDLSIAQEIFLQQRNMPESFDHENNTQLKFIVNQGWHQLTTKLGLNEIDFDISLRKLEISGLLKQLVGMYIGYSGGLYLITPAYIRLMKFIEFSANEPLFGRDQSWE